MNTVSTKAGTLAVEVWRWINKWGNEIVDKIIRILLDAVQCEEWETRTTRIFQTQEIGWIVVVFHGFRTTGGGSKEGMSLVWRRLS